MGNNKFTWLLAGPLFVPLRVIPPIWRERCPEAVYKHVGYLWRIPIVRGLESVGMGVIDPYSSDIGREICLRGQEEAYLEVLKEVDGIMATMFLYHMAGTPKKETHLKMALDYWKGPFVVYAPDIIGRLRPRFSRAQSFGWIIPRCGLIRDYSERKGCFATHG